MADFDESASGQDLNTSEQPNATPNNQNPHQDDDDDDVDLQTGTAKTAAKKNDDDDDEFEFANFAKNNNPSNQTKKAMGASGGLGASTVIHDQHHDEAVEIDESGDHDESIASSQATSPNNAPNKNNNNNTANNKNNKTRSTSDDEEDHQENLNDSQSEIMNNSANITANTGNKSNSEDKKQSQQSSKPEGHKAGTADSAEEESEEEEETGPPVQAKLYNPADYKNLNVSSEIQDLFDYIGRYKPSEVELETKLKPFIPDYIPAVGDIDNFLKIGPPDDSSDGFGLKVLDEPNSQQSDQTVLELKLRNLYKQTNLKPVTVRSIENADKNPRKITKWIQSIDEIHRQKPPPMVAYSREMPDIESLMQAWPREFESLLSSTSLATGDIDLSTEEFARVICALLDIPVYDGKVTESLHVLFTLFSEFRNNAHFH